MKKWLLVLFVMSLSEMTLACQDSGSGRCGDQGWSGNRNNQEYYYGNRGGNYTAPPPQVVYVDYYAVIATNLDTGRWGWSTGYTDFEVAKRDAIRNCEGENGEYGPCDWRAFNKNGCIAVAIGQNKNKTITNYPSQSGICGQTEQEALQICKANKHKNCKIDIQEINSQYLYWLNKY